MLLSSFKLNSVKSKLVNLKFKIPNDGILYVENFEQLNILNQTNKNKITKIILSESIKAIPKNAFYGLNNLRQVFLPKKLEEIGSNAFFRCRALESITIPNSVTKIGKNAFRECQSLVEVKLPKDITYIESGVFSYCDNLKNIELPNNITTIDSCAFQGCGKLVDIKMPESLKKIVDNAFSDCASLEKIVLPKYVSLVGNRAFSNCQKLSNIVLNEKLREIGKFAFSSCKSITKLHLPDSLLEIGDNAFYDCVNLESIKIPSRVREIKSHSFSGCIGLKTIELPDKLASIFTNAFEDCVSLTDISVPNSVNYIGDYAFAGCKELKDFKFPENLKTIKKMTFSECTNLKNVTFSDSIVKISDLAFNDCKKLTNVVLPKFLDEISGDAFNGCESLKNLTLKNCRIKAGNNKPFPCVSNLRIEGELSGVTSNLFDGRDVIELLNNLEYYQKSLITNINDYLYYQKINNKVVLTNNKEKIDLRYLYVFNTCLNKGCQHNEFEKIKFVNLISQANEYEIPLPKGLPDEFDKCNLSKFKRVSNILEREYFADNITNRDVMSFYIFAYNLGAFDKNEQVRTDVCNFLKDKLSRNEICLENMYRDYRTLQLKGYNKEFTAFVLNNPTALFKEGPEFFCEFNNRFKDFMRWNTSNKGKQRQLKPSIEKFKEYYNEITSSRYCLPKDKEYIGEEIFKFFTTKEALEAVDILNEKEGKNIPDYIVGDSEKLKDESGGSFTFEWISKSDPVNFTIGKYCSCCSHISGLGNGIVKASVIEPDVQTMVIKKDGEIVAKSTIYISRENCYGVFNTIEVSDKMQRADKQEIYNAYMRGVNKFVMVYNAENQNAKLKQINVGMHSNDLDTLFIDSITRDTLNSFDYSKYDKSDYKGDAMHIQGQACVYKEEKNAQKVVAVEDVYTDIDNDKLIASSDKTESDENNKKQVALPKSNEKLDIEPEM